MSDPGVGTPVIYHDGTTGADLPGVVVVTHDSWTESMADPEVWNIDQPDEGSPYILTFGYFGDSVALQAAEGTASGDYSLLPFVAQ